MTGIFAIAVQEISDFRLQMPGNAVLFVALMAFAARNSKEGRWTDSKARVKTSRRQGDPRFGVLVPRDTVDILERWAI